MEHRLIDKGRSSARLIGATSFYTGLALAPLALSLTLSSYVVIGRHLGVLTGVIGGLSIGGFSVTSMFAFDHAILLASPKFPLETSQTPLRSEIKHLLNVPAI